MFFFNTCMYKSPKMIETLKIIKESNGDIIILSDSNTIYIEEFLTIQELKS